MTGKNAAPRSEPLHVEKIHGDVTRTQGNLVQQVPQDIVPASVSRRCTADDAIVHPEPRRADLVYSRVSAAEIIRTPCAVEAEATDDAGLNSIILSSAARFGSKHVGRSYKVHHQCKISTSRDP